MSTNQELGELAGQVDPPSFLAGVAQLLRGGLPGQSMSDGRGSSAGIPGFDKFDRLLRRKRRRYLQLYAEIERGLRELDQMQQWLLPAPALTPDEERGKVPCANLRCLPTDEHPNWGYLEAGRKSGECGRCRLHRHRHGLEYPDVAEIRVTSL